MIDAQLPVRELAVRHPQLLVVFEEHGIDYCCGGTESLAAAAEKSGVVLELLVRRLEAALAQPAPREAVRDWTQVSLGELADHIEHTHHAMMRALLPEVEATLLTVAQVHRAAHGELLRELAEIYRALRPGVERHLAEEEQHLFPAIKQCEGRCSTGGAAIAWEEELVEAIAHAIAEHETVGAALREIRVRTGGFTLPDDAYPTFARLYRGLQTIEHDLRRHVHLENNVLFPRAVEMTRCHDAH